MSFLTLNGWAIEAAAAENPRGSYQRIGPSGRASRGSMRRGERAQCRSWTVSTPIQSEDEGNAIEHLVNGRGWHVSFNDSLYSGLSLLGPNSGYNATLGTSAPTPKYGTRRLNVSSSGGSCAWLTTLLQTDTWTLGFWHNYNNATPGANSYDHYVIVSDNGSVTTYKNGAVGAAISNYSVSVSTLQATVSLLGKTTAGVNTALSYYDDMVILPWVATASLVAAWYAAGRAFSDLPQLEMGGDIIRETGPVLVTGEVKGYDYAMAVVDGTWSDNAKILSFVLEEWTPG